MGRLTALQRLEGHDAGVWAACWAGSSSKLLSGSLDETVKVWEQTPDALRFLHTYEGHTLGVVSVAVHSGGDVAASSSLVRGCAAHGSCAHGARICCPAPPSACCMRAWPCACARAPSAPHAHPLHARPRVRTATQDSVIRVWNLNTHETLSLIETAATETWSITFGPQTDALHLATAGGSRGAVVLWSVGASAGQETAMQAELQLPQVRAWHVRACLCTRMMLSWPSALPLPPSLRMPGAQCTPPGSARAASRQHSLRRQQLPGSTWVAWRSICPAACARLQPTDDRSKARDRFVLSVAYSPDGRRLACGAIDGTVGAAVAVRRHWQRLQPLGALFPAPAQLLPQHSHLMQNCITRATCHLPRRVCVHRVPVSTPHATGCCV